MQNPWRSCLSTLVVCCTCLHCHLITGMENQQNPPYHYNQPYPIPPRAGAPPYNSGPPPSLLLPGQQFGQGGRFPPGPTPGLFALQQYPPFQQFGAPLPGQQQSPPTYYPPPHVQWAQSGMEQGYHGMDPRYSQSGGPSFSYARGYHQQWGPVNPPQGGMGSDPWRPPPDQMPPPPAPQQQQDGSRWNAPPPSGPPSYQRPPPPSHQQNSSMLPASGLASFQQPQLPNTQPILKRSTGEAGLASGFKESSALNCPMDPGEYSFPTEENKGMSSVSTNPDETKKQ